MLSRFFTGCFALASLSLSLSLTLSLSLSLSLSHCFSTRPPIVPSPVQSRAAHCSKTRQIKYKKTIISNAKSIIFNGTFITSHCPAFQWL